VTMDCYVDLTASSKAEPVLHDLVVSHICALKIACNVIFATVQLAMEYIWEWWIAAADKRQRIVLQLGGWAWCLKPLTVESKLVTKHINEPDLDGFFG
jgi:hypothetical protein